MRIGSITCLAVVCIALANAQNSTDPRTWTVPQTLTQNKYPNEIHWITTEDGYILQVHRLTGSPNSNADRETYPVVVTHSLCSSSFDFIGLGPKRSLAYLLADNGFDVWLVNNRGNEYSTNHTTLDPRSTLDRRYWNFSWHEMGVYDLPATIDYVRTRTGSERVFHIGMSEGATQYYVMLAERPEYNQRIVMHFSYAPAVFLCHLSNLPTLILTFPERFGLSAFVNQFAGSYSVVPNSEVYRFLTSSCPINALTESFCGSIYNPFANSNAEQQDRIAQRTILAHEPSGCSTKTLIHFTQSVRSCGFGPYQNNFFKERVSYNLSNVRTPIYTYHSSYDRFVDPLDVYFLNDSLPNGFVGSSENRVLGHADFLFGISARKLVYDDTIRRMRAISNDSR